MAGYDLSINMDELRKLAEDLTAVRDEFDNADDNADETADATGHDELREVVNSFADEWRIRRGKMMEDLNKLTDIINQIAEAFTEVDTELAKALEEKANEKAKA